MTDFLFPELEADHQNTKQVEELKQARKLSRSTDPETSKVAAQKLIEAGTNATHMARVENAVEALTASLARYPTAHEVAEWSGLDHVQAQRRLSEHETLGTITKDGEIVDGEFVENKIHCDCARCRTYKRAWMCTWKLPR